ncbi:hypothetical protein ACHAW6_003933 [Cyclotella cf. meneghiniana]
MDILHKNSGYKFFTKLSISMQYYTFEHDEHINHGKSINGIDDANVYIDDVGAFSPDWDHHIKLLSTILHHLQENGFTINPLKCEWAIKGTDWLDYYSTGSKTLEEKN